MSTETIKNGEDWPIELSVADESGVPVDMSGWSVRFMVKRRLSVADDDALIDKSTGDGLTISGTYDADPAVNTQVISGTIEDEETDGIKPGTCHFEWKRTDEGFERVLGSGLIVIARGASRT